MRGVNATDFHDEQTQGRRRRYCHYCHGNTFCRDTKIVGTLIWKKITRIEEKNIRKKGKWKKINTEKLIEEKRRERDRDSDREREIERER